MTQPTNPAFVDALATWQQAELGRAAAQDACNQSTAAFESAQQAAIAAIRTLQGGGTVDDPVGIGTALVAAQADYNAKQAALTTAISARDNALSAFCKVYATAVGADPVQTEQFIRGAI